MGSGAPPKHCRTAKRGLFEVPHLAATSPGSSGAIWLFPDFNASFPVPKSSVSPGAPAPLQADCQWQSSTCLFHSTRGLFSVGFFIYLHAWGFLCDEKHTLQMLVFSQYMHFRVLFSCNSSLSTNMGHVRKIWVSPEWILGKIPCWKSTSTAGNALMFNALLVNKICYFSVLLNVGIGTYFRSNYCQHFWKILRAFLCFFDITLFGKQPAGNEAHLAWAGKMRILL